ncbi:Multi-domain regulatory protein [Streptomyces venezuelae]|uniref:ATP-binding protein n=1 Tax=Streptomyces gardneri TaxID=66892 RepID=UPI0006BDBDA3|nr:BTAD domain-containing putative transcriptional regulator [Streptomyces gardneri]ALO06404.1 Multi-domain regulatory protein [Streptomyces venezuelae]QPK43848.1 AAA family ATPase [Streptomyces gardneri]WRK35105.1 BTAD domain-containing putative transcriptional regulator [Streptomyces venezuelae]CUM43335.1 Signal transduction response regulator / Disease resistance domain-containing protein / Tetratricopeptide repeat-containing protein [Streptomyces venezuelae]
MQPSYRVLGPCQALRSDDGTEATLSGARLRALLTALAAGAADTPGGAGDAGGAGAGRAMSAGALIAQVWADDDPAAFLDRTAALQALVGRLRRAVGHEAVVSTPGGYRLSVDPDAVDLHRFERLAAEGSAALADGDAARAAALLDEALGLWRGPALADLPGRDADPLVVRLEQRHARARRDRYAADLALGRAADVLAPLAALAAGHPLDEPVQALRIRALRAAGRPSEALAAYEEVRAGLADRLGTDPGPELRALHAELLGATTTAPARGPASDRGGRLPAWLTSFIGRDGELGALAAGWADRRLVTLTGPGGVGKTRLALEAAETFDGGPVHVAELASVREESSVAAAVLSALGARETQLWNGPAVAEAAGPKGALAHLVEYCSGRRMLLVLDNCEHVISAAAELAETLLTRCPGVTVLATSREPLGVPGEALSPLGPLPVEMALRLLGERGAAARPGFRVADDAGAAEEVCRRLDGLPLAIELAAARLRMLSVRQIADRLDDRFRLLTSGARTVLPRQQTLRAVVDWSWELLDGPERAVLRRLAVFTGGCDLAAAETVCAEDGAGPDALEVLGVLDVLGALVDKSLVVAGPGPDGEGTRFRLLETVAEYASERLDDAGERAATERRHLTYYRELARRTDPELRGPGQVTAFSRLEREHGNLRAALRTAVAIGDEQEALCLVHSLSWFWQLRNHQTDARTWAATAAGLGPDPFQEPVRPAEPFEGRCVDVPPPWTGERLREARRGGRLYALATEGGHGATSLERPETRARLTALVAAYRPGLPQTCRQPGAMWFFARLMTGELTGLDEALTLTVEACRDHGTGWDLGFALLMRGKLLGHGPADADEALALFEAAEDAWGIAESLSARGEAYERAGRLPEAAADFQRAAHAAALVGARSQVPLFTARLAAVRLRLRPEGNEAAERLLAEAADEAGEWGTEAAGTGRMLLAQHYGHTGRTALARAQLTRLEEEFGEHTPTLFWGLAGGMWAWLDCLDGAHEQALDRLARAVVDLEALAHLVAPYLVVAQFATAAWARAGRGGPDDAETGAALLGAYDTHIGPPTGGGFRPFAPQTETAIRTRAEQALRARLTPEAYTRHYEEGTKLVLDTATAFVRRPEETGSDA